MKVKESMALMALTLTNVVKFMTMNDLQKVLSSHCLSKNYWQKNLKSISPMLTVTIIDFVSSIFHTKRDLLYISLLTGRNKVSVVLFHMDFDFSHIARSTLSHPLLTAWNKVYNCPNGFQFSTRSEVHPTLFPACGTKCGL